MGVNYGYLMAQLLNRGRLFVKEVLADVVVVVEVANCERDNPSLSDRGIRGAVGQEAEGLLADYDQIIRGGHAYHGEAALEDPGVHQRPNRFAGRFLERIPEVGRLGVAEAILIQVVGDAAPIGLGAQVALEHSQYAAALFVGNDVEHSLTVRRVRHGVFDRAGRMKRVRSLCGGAKDAERVPLSPGRVEVVGGEGLHVGGERLVEPETVPPLHGYQIPEPHMGDLVRNHIDDSFALRLGGGIFVNQ